MLRSNQNRNPTKQRNNQMRMCVYFPAPVCCRAAKQSTGTQPPRTSEIELTDRVKMLHNTLLCARTRCARAYWRASMRARVRTLRWNEVCGVVQCVLNVAMLICRTFLGVYLLCARTAPPARRNYGWWWCCCAGSIGAAGAISSRAFAPLTSLSI